MASDGAGTSDEVIVELNPEGGPVTSSSNPLLRPDQGAERAAWVDYVVRLGADRDIAEGRTTAWDDATEDYVLQPELTVDELTALADRLGG